MNENTNEVVQNDIMDEEELEEKIPDTIEPVDRNTDRVIREAIPRSVLMKEKTSIPNADRKYASYRWWTRHKLQRIDKQEMKYEFYKTIDTENEELFEQKLRNLEARKQITLILAKEKKIKRASKGFHPIKISSTWFKNIKNAASRWVKYLRQSTLYDVNDLDRDKITSIVDEALNDVSENKNAPVADANSSYRLAGDNIVDPTLNISGKEEQPEGVIDQVLGIEDKKQEIKNDEYQASPISPVELNETHLDDFKLDEDNKNEDIAPIADTFEASTVIPMKAPDIDRTQSGIDQLRQMTMVQDDIGPSINEFNSTVTASMPTHNFTSDALEKVRERYTQVLRTKSSLEEQLNNQNNKVGEAQKNKAQADEDNLKTRERLEQVLEIMSKRADDYDQGNKALADELNKKQEEEMRYQQATATTTTKTREMMKYIMDLEQMLDGSHVNTNQTTAIRPIDDTNLDNLLSQYATKGESLDSMLNSNIGDNDMKLSGGRGK